MLLPVPDGWRVYDAKALADPAVRSDIVATFPGEERLLQAMEETGGHAVPVLLAVDPDGAGRPLPLGANITVLLSQPSVGGLLLDFVSGLICDGLTGVVGARSSTRTHGRLPSGEAVRCTYALPQTSSPVVAEAWVIGAPRGTLLVTMLGPSNEFPADGPEGLMREISASATGSPAAP
jgi:hypothetical protein